MRTSVLALAPLRVSFVGGGTDMPEYYLNHQNGLVVSTAIDKYVYVHLKKHDTTFSEKYRISYSEIEHCNEISEIKNSIISACLKVSNFNEPLQISTSSDIPAHSGLGSSSALAVALLSAIHEMKGENISKSYLAEEAFEAEREIAQVKCGKQDHFASAFGGFNSYHFLKNGNVTIEPIRNSNGIESFLNNCILIWTGQSRSASIILEDQSKKMPEIYENLNKIKTLAVQFKDEIVNNQLSQNRLAQIINKSWEEKIHLSTSILTKDIKLIIEKLSVFTLGLKISGAGGGGFILCVANNKIDLNKLENLGYKSFKFKTDNTGSRCLAVS